MPEICVMTKAWRSGAAWVAQMLAQAIAEQGATIAFVAPLADPAERDPKHARLTRITPPRELLGSHPKMKRVKASLSRIAGSILPVLRLRSTTRNFIFSIPEPLLFTLPLLAILRLTGARVIFIVHDAQPHAWALPQSLRRVERSAHALSYRLSTVLVTLTPAARDALVRDFGISPSKVHVIPHGPFSLGEASPIPGSGRLLTFGSLRRNKSVLEVIRGVILARRQGADVTLVLAGEPLKQEPGYWEECLAAIAEDPDGFDVREGFLPDEALPGLIATVDCFMLAYQNFNSQSGVGVLAALAGRPVIGTRSGGLDELFDRGLAGEIIEGDVTPESVARAIMAFRQKDIEEWRVLARDGVSSITETLRWDRIADEYIALCRKS
jgi:glycosyltransferase involved in cell wall biosynthesis